ncbi:phosphate ABC transporter substrate-binding protein PstS [Actinomycetospora chiangmaiensis]|uniref:phosphate ABC transporter substrate-binding protein PstS n=1 Tax=Actinomycetospora chiangmaiensis TaxID=402650 RepID=UPI000381F98F|nr:phosphate ABC transporter substrate-binding protein PstS [Actinomycetospora chiangmaiensis]
MRFQRRAAAVGLIAAGALLFSACGSDNNSGGGSAPQATGVTCGGKQALKASGSTAQANAITGFVNTFEQTCNGQTVNYTASGSGAGRNDFTGGQTDFAGSDAALSSSDLPKAQARCNSTPLNLPMVFGPIAIAYNVPGVSDLALDGPTAAKIFNGTVKTWNDPAIAALNPGKTLPANPIVVNFRSDDSGTTQNFQTYLNAASNNAYGKPSTQTFNGGVGAGARGSQGVTDATKNTQYSIGYIEASFAQKAQLPTAGIINAGGGSPVALSTDNVGKAINAVQVTGQGNDLTLDLNSLYKTTTPGAYPIALATYEIVCSKYADPQTGTAVKAFLQTALSPQAQGTLTSGGYVPIPDAFKQRLSTSINSIS